MEPVFNSALAERRAETAAFIVSLYNVYREQQAVRNDRDAPSALQFPPPPAHISTVLHEECHQVAQVLASAANNIYTLDWDATQYAASVQKVTMGSEQYEESLLRRFPPLIPVQDVLDEKKPLPVIPDPCVFCDIRGRRVSWSLPSIMPERLQGLIRDVTAVLEGRLSYDHVSPSEPLGKKWRTADRYFGQGDGLQPGQVFIGAAWFEQGHLPPKYAPIVLAATKTTEAEVWMSAMQEPCQILDGILAVTHPTLYAAGRRLMQRLYEDDARARAIVHQWPSVYHAVHVIVNRETVYHRDINGLPGWYDLLLSWIAIGAAGLECCTGCVVEPRAGLRRCIPLELLLKHVEWKPDRSLRFNARTFDPAHYLQVCGSIANSSDLASMDAVWSHPKWWMWPESGPENSPSWWLNPPMFLSHPMPLYSTDLHDLSQDAEGVRRELQAVIETRASAVDSVHVRFNELERQLYGDG
ncbi:hypothetical protein C8Q76DRAFT_803016 [Earliella scabrosa]|nr:hypothetical protein C8Q76DRAFT_803016 [Earliella scabrosa]